VPKAAERFGPENVVISSLTKTAAAEIASRGLKIPEQNVGTLHALAYRALDRPEIGETKIAEWNEAEPLYAMSGGSTAIDEPQQRTERGSTGDQLCAQSQLLRHNRVPRSKWPHGPQQFQAAWDRWLASEDMMDFTGLIEAALEDVSVAPGNPAVFLVDEAQDCSVLELDLIRHWNESAEYTVLAGDGDQSIYGWRGASVRAFLSPGLPEENNFHLTQSYRISKAVHAFASRWIKQAAYRYAVNYEPTEVEGEVRRSMGSSRAVDPIMREIQEDLDDGKQVMVLATCGYMLSRVIRALREEGIPFHNPYRPAHGGWNPLRGGSRRLLAFLRPDPRVNPQPRLWTWREAQEWVELLKSSGTLPSGAKKKVRKLADDRPNALIDPKTGPKVFGAHTWDELQYRFRRGTEIEWLRDRTLPSKRKMMEYACNIAEKQGGRVLAEEPRLVVGSIHSTKGSECDCCYLFPDLSSSGMREWTGGAEGRDGVVRTFYVGATRAKEKLVLASRASALAVEWGA
jgi:superfamily I DNA/RNA helicase